MNPGSKVLQHAKGVIMGAGFEGPSEMLFLGKPLLAIPMKNQYEQLCNAKALEQIGIDTISGFSPKQSPKIQDWLEHLPSIRKEYKPVSRTGGHYTIRKV